MSLPRAQPIIPTWRKEPFDDPEWVFEFKYDGIRALLYVEKQSCRLLWGRRSALGRFDTLCDQLATNLEVDDAILDGQVIAADKPELQRFYKVLRLMRKPTYVASDLLWLNGADLRPLPLSERQRRLRSILPKRSSVIFEALSVQGRGRELFELMHAHDLEGIVAKRLDDPYNPQVRWLKIKNPNCSQKEGQGRAV